MFENLKSRLKLRNPFPTHEPVGEAIYLRLVELQPEEAEAEYNKLTAEAKVAYQEWMRAKGNRELFWRVTGIAFVAGVGAAVVLAITADEEDEEEEDFEDEEDEEEEDKEIEE